MVHGITATWTATRSAAWISTAGLRHVDDCGISSWRRCLTAISVATASQQPCRRRRRRSDGSTAQTQRGQRQRWRLELEEHSADVVSRPHGSHSQRSRSDDDWSWAATLLLRSLQAGTTSLFPVHVARCGAVQLQYSTEQTLCLTNEKSDYFWGQSGVFWRQSNSNLHTELATMSIYNCIPTNTI